MGRLKKAATISVFIGLVCWGIIFITGASYPDTLYNVLMPLGLLLMFLALLLFAISWVLGVYQDFRMGNYGVAILSIILGVTGVIWGFVQSL